MQLNNNSKITAVLGPTNTGKTHMAIETMLNFESGILGFPLRLLAREVYEKILKRINRLKKIDKIKQDKAKIALFIFLIFIKFYLDFLIIIQL